MARSLRGVVRWTCRGRGRRLLTVASAVLAGVPLLTGMTQPPGGASGLSGPAKLRPVAHAKPVPVLAVPDRKVKVPVLHPWHRTPVTWPAAGAATATLSAAGGGAGAAPAGAAAQDNAVMAGVVAGSVRAGSLPVWTGPAASAAKTGTAAHTAVPGSVRVSMASRQTAVAAGVSGVIFSVARADGKTAA